MHSTVYEEIECFARTLDPEREMRIADVGACDVNGCLRPIFARYPRWTYVGLDVAAGPNVDVIVPGVGVWSNIGSESFDHVVSVSTLEHTLYPWLVVQEMGRIVKKGGLVCLTAPYSWEYHAFPIDAWRLFPDGMRAIMELAGLCVEKVYTKACAEEPRWGDTVAVGRKA